MIVGKSGRGRPVSERIWTKGRLGTSTNCGSVAKKDLVGDHVPQLAHTLES